MEKNEISCDVIDLLTIRPIDWESIFNSVKVTGRILALDTGFTTGSVAGEIIARVSMECFDILKCKPSRLAMPDIPEPTSPALTKGFYVRASDIVIEVLKMLNKNFSNVNIAEGDDFLEGRQSTILELPPQQIIVAFSHGSNQSSRRIPPIEQPPSCFWGFPKEYLIFIHKLAGVEIEDQSSKKKKFTKK